MSKWVDENYINRLSPDQLRRELQDALDFQYELLDAMKNQVELPSPYVLKCLDHGASWPEDKAIGNMLQPKHGLDVVPPVSECESAAGLWWRILQGLKAERP
ncbi:hypothetical protein AB8Z38_30310 [Bradyrhizobium sp. LLZ17]|uniref:Uncharacterized protein n=1 Tax=Bradyrhizobium sp. LLZ17 TaxID=3239388 RepID=A0AB39XGH0_9BRAD|nr:hypothetical protein [Bradyrhizobium sp. WSM1417]